MFEEATTVNQSGRLMGKIGRAYYSHATVMKFMR